MEKKFILIVLSFFIFSCGEQTIHSFDKTGIEIVRGKINMMPSGNILVRAFYDGRPSEKVDKNFKNTIKLTSIYPITINGIHNNLVSEEF